MKPILFGSPISPFVRKVAVTLFEKAIDFEWKPVRPHDRDPEFAAISPIGKIPAYKDDKIAVSDSSVICMYLEKIHPAPPIYFDEPVQLAKALWWEEFFDDHMIVPIRNYFFHTWLNPLVGRPYDKAIADEGFSKMPALFDYLEAKLERGKWAVADRFSIADISLASTFVNLGWMDYRVDAAKYPVLADYVTRALSRPSFKQCAAFEATFIAALKEKNKR